MSWPDVLLGEVAASIDCGLTASASIHGDWPKFLRIRAQLFPNRLCSRRRHKAALMVQPVGIAFF